jgi:hypothetical protein
MNEDCPKWFAIFKYVFMAMYATGVTAASFWYFFKLTFGVVPEDNQNFANLILGFLIGTAISTFLGYFFGASQSASALDKKDAEQKPEPPKVT